ncbi:hypothetical protein NL676_024306 [Syzygium grande]|nr:hypothetical protein NL676_024306 [Syzygium grande]
MADVSDSDKSPRRHTVLSKTNMKGDGSARRAEIPVMYRLESSNGPGNVLIACNLNGDNYLTWSRGILIALRAKCKLPFIDGSLQKPEEDDPMRERWEICNSTILAWLFNTMEKDLQSTVAYAMDAKELWDDLKERYSEGNQTRIYQIKLEICILKQDGKTNNKFMAQPETEKIFQFLMGLTSEFNTVRSNILSIEPMLSLNKVYQMIVHEERQKLVVRSHDSTPEAAVFLVKGGGGPNNVGKQQQQSSEARLVCEHCGKLGHTNSNCWALNGYPAWYTAEKSKGKKPIGQGRGTGQSQWKRGWPRVKTPNPQGPDRANAKMDH